MYKLLIIVIVVSLLLLACRSLNTSTNQNQVASKDNTMTPYDICVKNGGRILKSYPPQCINEKGEKFVKEA